MEDIHLPCRLNFPGCHTTRKHKNYCQSCWDKATVFLHVFALSLSLLLSIANVHVIVFCCQATLEMKHERLKSAPCSVSPHTGVWYYCREWECWDVCDSDGFISRRPTCKKHDLGRANDDDIDIRDR